MATNTTTLAGRRRPARRIAHHPRRTRGRTLDVALRLVAHLAHRLAARSRTPTLHRRSPPLPLPARPAVLLASFLCLTASVFVGLKSGVSAKTTKHQRADTGALTVFNSDGKPAGACPLKHTDVKAEITGFLARVTVTQEFVNPFSD